MQRRSSSIKISAVICSYNRYDVLRTAIQSIEAQILNSDHFELIIVDNSSPSNLRDEFINNVNIMCNAKYIVEDIPGLSRARNIGVDIASGEYVAFMDDDAIAQPDWLLEAVTRFDSDDKIGILGGPVEPIWESPRPVWLHEWQEGYLTIVDRGEEARILKPDEWLAGTNIFFRTNALKAAGGFDTSIGRVGKLLLSNEELKVTENIKSMGYVSYYDPKIKVMHRVHSDRLDQRWFRRRVAWQMVSEILGSPDIAQQTSDKHWSRIKKYIESQPIRQRHVEALVADIKNKDQFQLQLEAIESLMKLMLIVD